MQLPDRPKITCSLVYTLQNEGAIPSPARDKVSCSGGLCSDTDAVRSSPPPPHRTYSRPTPPPPSRVSYVCMFLFSFFFFSSSCLVVASSANLFGGVDFFLVVVFLLLPSDRRHEPIQLSAARFFVDVLPLLEGVPVISARSLFEPQFPGSPLCWKVRTHAACRWSLRCCMYVEVCWIECLVVLFLLGLS